MQTDLVLLVLSTSERRATT